MDSNRQGARLVVGPDGVTLEFDPFARAPRRGPSRRFVAIMAAAVFLGALGGCAGQPGPGGGCDACDRDALAAPKGGGAAALGGQDASSQPDLGDAGAQNPVTTIGRGSGSTSATSSYTADKTQAGAIAVNQAWTADSSAIAEAVKTAPPSVLAGKAYLEQLSLLVAGAAPGSPEQTALLDRQEKALLQFAKTNAEWLQGLAALAPHHDWRGALLLQVVLSGSATNGARAVDPANAEAAAKGIPATVDAAARVRGSPLPAEAGPEPLGPHILPGTPGPAPETKPAAAPGMEG